MAAVTQVNVRPVQVIEAKIGKAAAAFTRGKPVVIDSAAAVDPRYPCTYKAATAEVSFDGIVLRDCLAGREVEVLTRGELEGFSGLTPGQTLTVLAGVIDNTAAGSGLERLKAISATRVWVKC